MFHWLVRTYKNKEFIFHHMPEGLMEDIYEFDRSCIERQCLEDASLSTRVPIFARMSTFKEMFGYDLRICIPDKGQRYFKINT